MKKHLVQTFKLLLKSILYCSLIVFLLQTISIVENMTAKENCQQFTLIQYYACIKKPYEWTSNDFFRERKVFRNNIDFLKNKENSDTHKIIETYSNSMIDSKSNETIYHDQLLNSILEEKINQGYLSYVSQYVQIKQNNWSDELLLRKSIFFLEKIKEQEKCEMFNHMFYIDYQKFTEKNHYDNLFIDYESVCKKEGG